MPCETPASGTLEDCQFDLADRAIHVWLVRTEASSPVAVQFQGVLSDDEISRAERYRFDHLRQSFIVTRGSLRVLLGRYLGRAPSDIRFRYGEHGKPGLARSIPIEFNVSHSGALALFAFTRGCRIGVDLEQIRQLPDMEQIAARFFASEEAAELMSAPSDQRQRAFFQCWTRKEAYVKAIGAGLSDGLRGFRVASRPGEPILMRPVDDSKVATAWTLVDLNLARDKNLDAEWSAALAYEDAPRRLRLRSVIQPGVLFG